jgi:hypothetical protein
MGAMSNRRLGREGKAVSCRNWKIDKYVENLLRGGACASPLSRFLVVGSSLSPTEFIPVSS